MIKKIRHIILSRSTALLLIVLIGILCLIGVNVPQVSNITPGAYAQWKVDHQTIAVVAETLQFNHMYTSTIFLVTLGILFLTMVYSLINVYFAVKRKVPNKDVSVEERYFQNFFSFNTSSTSAIETMSAEAQKRKYEVSEISSNKFLLHKNTLNRFGTLLFHLGVVTIVISGLLTFLFEQRGFVQLLEGDTFFGSEQEFLTNEHGPLSSSFAPAVNISLVKLTPKFYDNGANASLASSLMIGKRSEQMKEETLAINEPYTVDGVKIYQSTSFGYTVGLRLEKNGETIPTYFSLDQPAKLGKPYVGISDYPMTDYIFQMQLTPDPVNRSFELNQPVLELKIEDHGAVKYAGSMKPGDSIQFDDRTLTFIDIRYWSGLILTESRFTSLVFIGFGLVLLGLVLIYIFPMREIYIAVEHRSDSIQLSFGGVARRERALFAEEFNEFVESIFMKEGVVSVRTELVEV